MDVDELVIRLKLELQPASILTDQAGDIRIFSLNVDMGAYEYQGNSYIDAPIITNRNVILTADAFCTDVSGWIHFFNNTTGQQVYLSTHSVRAGRNFLKISLAALAEGYYYLRVSTQYGDFAKAIMIER